MTRCKNCNTQLTGAFCPQCGQKDVELERPVYELLGEVLRETLDLDGRAARTLRTMFASPGVLTASFLAGRRKQYSSPVRLYLVVSVLFFLIVAWTARQGLLFDLTPDSAGELRVLAEDLPALMFVFLPVFALLLKLAFWQRLYFDHLIHSVHIHTAAYVVLALLLPLENIAGRHLLLLALHLALGAYLCGYLIVSIRRVYAAGWVATVVKALAVLFVYVSILAVSLEFVSDLSVPWSTHPRMA